MRRVRPLVDVHAPEFTRRTGIARHNVKVNVQHTVADDKGVHVLGVLAVAILRNGLNVLSVDPSLQVVSVGILLITALLIGGGRSSAQESEK